MGLVFQDLAGAAEKLARLDRDLDHRISVIEDALRELAIPVEVSYITAGDQFWWTRHRGAEWRLFYSNSRDGHEERIELMSAPRKAKRAAFSGHGLRHLLRTLIKEVHDEIESTGYAIPCADKLIEDALEGKL